MIEGFWRGVAQLAVALFEARRVRFSDGSSVSEGVRPTLLPAEGPAVEALGAKASRLECWVAVRRGEGSEAAGAGGRAHGAEASETVVGPELGRARQHSEAEGAQVLEGAASGGI